jgi:hypothetical protein
VRSSAVSDGIGKEIHAHPERGLPLFGRIVVHFGILPPVTQIALIRVVDRQASIQEDPEPLSRLSVMDVDLRYALW